RCSRTSPTPPAWSCASFVATDSAPGARRALIPPNRPTPTAFTVLSDLDLGNRESDPLRAVRTTHRRAAALGLADRVEGRANVADAESAARVDGDRDDVEPATHAVEPSPFQIVLGQARQTSLLVPGDCGRRRLVPSRATTLDLDEDDHVVVATHEVD